jgi:hypothetical protein
MSSSARRSVNTKRRRDFPMKKNPTHFIRGANDRYWEQFTAMPMGVKAPARPHVLSWDYYRGLAFFCGARYYSDAAGHDRAIRSSCTNID